MSEAEPKKKFVRKMRIDAGIPLEKIDEELAADNAANADASAAAKPERVERTDGFAAEVAQAMRAEEPEGNPSALVALPRPASKLVYLPVKSLKESPTNPRKTFAKMEELAASIKAAGLLVPLIIRELRRKGADEGTEYEIVAGHRRFRAAKLAGLKEVPCDVRTLTDAQVTEIQITENLQRSDLSDLEQAETYEALRDLHHYSVDQIAAKIGVSKGTVYSRLKLLALGPEARKALADGVLPASAAVPLARITSHKLQASALKTMRDRYDYGDGVLAAREAIEFLQREFCRSLKGAPFSLSDATLLPEAGACGTCPKNTKVGVPGLFEDFGSSAPTCTDVPCFQLKAKAAWKRVEEKEVKRGAEVLSPDEGAKLYQHSNTLSYGSKLVELDEKNHADPKKRTWGELLETLPEDKRPQRVVVPDRDLTPHACVDRKALVTALADKGAKWAEQEIGRETETKKARAELRESRQDDELRRNVLGLGLVAFASKGPFLDSLQTAVKLMAKASCETWSKATTITSLGFENGSKEWSAFEAKLREGKASFEHSLAYLLLETLSEAEDTEAALEEGEYPGAIKRLLSAVGVSLADIEKAQRATEEAEATLKGKSKKKEVEE